MKLAERLARLNRAKLQAFLQPEDVHPIDIDQSGNRLLVEGNGMRGWIQYDVFVPPQGRASGVSPVLPTLG